MRQFIASPRLVSCLFTAALFGMACTGEDGADGAGGDAGVPGPVGQPGPDGQPGEGGPDGAAALVELGEIDVGDECPTGGVRVEAGLDADGDGTLDDDEVTDRRVVCNAVDGRHGDAGTDGADGMDGRDGDAGVDGVDGADGADGADGTGALVVVVAEPPGLQCPVGGQRIDVGLDDGDGAGIAGDGVLHADEVDQRSYVCDVCPDADADGVCDAADACPQDARVAMWFPADTGSVEVTDLATDLRLADNMSSVTILDENSDPSLGELLSDFDAVIIGSNWGFGAKDPDQLGDLLADYVDAGGLVVDAMFNQTTWTGNGTQEFLGGRWLSDGYSSMVLAGQISAPVADVTLTVSEPGDPLVQDLDPAAFVADLNVLQSVYLTSGAVNVASPLGFVELAHWTYQASDYPAVVVSRHRERRVLGLVLSPIFNFDTLNVDPTTRDFLACSISQLVR